MTSHETVWDMELPVESRLDWKLSIELSKGKTTKSK